MPVDEHVLTSLEATESRLRSAIHTLNPNDTKRRLSPEKWAISEILGHLTDAELVTTFRLRQMLTTPDGIPVPSYDQDAWVVLGSYCSVPVEELLTRFAILRKANLALVRGLHDQQWQKYGQHAERGRESVTDLINIIAKHDVHHLIQIESIARALNAKPGES